MDDEELSIGDVHYFASLVAEGQSSPEDARRLLREFARSPARSKDIDARLIEHVRDCIATYLAEERNLDIYESGKVDPRNPAFDPSKVAAANIAKIVPVKSLEQAFGLTRAKRGNPALRDGVLMDAAADFLEARLAGHSDNEARAIVAQSRWDALLPVSSESHVAQAWKDHKRDALVLVRMRRRLRADRWTDDDVARLRELYAGVAGIILPGDEHPK